MTKSKNQKLSTNHDWQIHSTNTKVTNILESFYERPKICNAKIQKRKKQPYNKIKNLSQLKNPKI